MPSSSSQMIFSPQNCSLERLDATLTAGRRTLAEQILHQTRSSATAGAACNNLILGPRGSGKTHLLSYVRYTLEAEGAMRIVPLSEEERGIGTLLDFLLCTLRAMGLTDDALIDRLDPEPQHALIGAQKWFDEKTGGLPTLLLVENLSEIFDNLGEEGLSPLRAFLQERPFVSILASSIQLFTDSSRYDHPFYQYFTITPLNLLSQSEAREYLRALAEANGDADLAKALASPAAQGRVDAVYHLTGGNHRLLAMLSGFLSTEGLDSLVEPFVQMADRELTPYYQQRLDRLSAQQHKIIQAMANQPDGRAVPVKEIARRAFLSQQVVSRQLHDLLANEHVIRNQAGRESFYELREPLLRLMLDIKQGREKPLRLIVDLLRNWFTAKELQDLAGGVSGLAALYCREALAAVTAAFRGGMAPPAMQAHGTWSSSRSLMEEGTKMLSCGEREDALEKFRTLAVQHPAGPYALLAKALEMEPHEACPEAILIYDEIAEQFAHSEDLLEIKAVSCALLLKGTTLWDLEDPDGALEACKELDKRYAAIDDPLVQDDVAKALLSKGNILYYRSRLEEALAVYREVFSRFGASDQPELLEQCAWTLVSKGVALHALGRSDEAIATYNDVVSRYGASGRSELLQPCAWALFNKGVALHALGDSDGAIASYDEVISRCRTSQRPELLEQCARALFNKSNVLRDLGRNDEAIASYDALVSHYGTSERTEILEPCAKALVNKSAMLLGLGRGEEAIAACDEVVSRCGTSEYPELLEGCAWALFNKGVVLRGLGRSEEAIVAYDELVSRYGTSVQPAILEPCASALVNKSALLLEAENKAEALQACQQAVNIVPTFAPALSQYAFLLANKGDEDEALAMLKRFLDEVEPAYDLRAVELEVLLGRCKDRPRLLKKIVEAYGDDHASLAEGLTRWVKALVPLSKEDAEDLAKVEANVADAFSGIPGTEMPLKMLNVALRHALGDRKALFELPRELRQLIEG